MFRFVACLDAALAVIALAYMSYLWSFTETIMGGFVGFIAPPVLGTVCFILGRISTRE
jgi:hypothetical protein